ncbi:amidohydrolase [Microbacteriaceae bacterium VKM Ac-2854]|nr:amidohydrolase [Microbacteriaceae bacterium VKM Ac-2854]
MDPLFDALAARVRASEATVVALSRALLADPELAFAEHRSAARVAAVLAEAGFDVEHGVAGVATAFRASYGSGPFVVALCIEYDALPGIGHACGHNLIAGASVAAALALAPYADDLGITIRAVGTPAEEHGGGKTLLLEPGLLGDADVALMMHPLSEGLSVNPVGTSSQAVGRHRAIFHGRASHAAAAPQDGRNAADAAVIAQVALGLLRQQLPSDHRLAAYVEHGGEATNIIPDRVVVDFEFRTFSLPEFRSLQRRVYDCFRAGALATGTTVELEPTEPLYEPLQQDAALGASWNAAMAQLGYDVTPGPGLSGGSTDMGNVSRRVPSLHPWVGIPGVTTPIHTAGFAEAAGTDAAFRVMLDSALGLAWTAAEAARTR